MKIAIISFYDIYSPKWVEKVVKMIYEWLNKDIEFHIYSLRHELKNKNNRKEFSSYFMPNLCWLWYFLYILYIWLVLAINHKKYDKIVCNNINWFIPCLLKKYWFLKNIKIYTICHNVKKAYYDSIYWWKSYSYSQKIMLWVDKICYRYSDRIIWVSDWIKKQLIYNYQIQSENIDVVYNTIDLFENKFIELNKKEKRFVFISNDNIRKWVDIINNLWKRLEQSNSKYQIQIIWPDKSWINKCNNIIYIWSMSNEKTIEYISKSEILLLPSKNEWLPFVVLEWISVGTPFIASTESNIEMMNNKCGIVCKDIKSYKDWIDKVISNYEYYQNWCKEFLSNSDMKKFNNNYFKILNK